jgi:hypothetical protein
MDLANVERNHSLCPIEECRKISDVATIQQELDSMMLKHRPLPQRRIGPARPFPAPSVSALRMFQELGTRSKLLTEPC